MWDAFEAIPDESRDFSCEMIRANALRNQEETVSISRWSHLVWSFDYFFYNAAKRSRRERFAAYWVLASIFPETPAASAFQEKLARFSQNSSLVQQQKKLCKG